MHIAKHYRLPIIILTLGIIIMGLVIFVPLYAQEGTIVFPVEELGNCENKEECHSYCDDPANMRACISFAKAHNLMSKEEVERAEKFTDTLEGEGGPGGCTIPSECNSYCEDIRHLNECIAFADKNGHEDGQVEDGRKIAKYLNEGGQMPGGCTSRQSCEFYCSNFEHAEECLLFAEEAGLDIDKDLPDDVDRNQLRTIIDLMNRGETPGGCTSERECEVYCSSNDHFEECIVFGEKVGFISSKEAAMARKTGGKGPGGCTSKEECDAFCNNPNNREQCFAFAKEHGLIGEDELHNLEEGLNRLDEVLNEAPEGSIRCLEDNLGRTIVSDIRSGTVSPGPELVQKIEACIERGFQERAEQEFERMMSEMSPEVRTCIEGEIGTSIRDAFESGNEKLEPIVHKCFESSNRPPVISDDFRSQDSREMPAPHVEDGVTAVPSQSATPVDWLSPQMKECAINRFGENFQERLVSGELSATELTRGVEECMRNDMQSAQTQSQFDTTIHRDSLLETQPQYEEEPVLEPSDTQVHESDFESSRADVESDAHIDSTDSSVETGEVDIIRDSSEAIEADGVQSSVDENDSVLANILNIVKRLFGR